MKKVTKPKQAASARELDRWQITVQRIMGAMADEDYASARAQLDALLRSMRRAEQR